MKRSWSDRLAELGTLGAVVHLVGFAACMIAMGAGIRFGLLDAWPWLAERLPADATTWIGAYALTKVLSLPRIGVTLAVTPVVARLRGRASPESAAG